MSESNRPSADRIGDAANISDNDAADLRAIEQRNLRVHHRLERWEYCEQKIGGGGNSLNDHKVHDWKSTCASLLPNDHHAECVRYNTAGDDSNYLYIERYFLMLSQ